MLYATGEGTAVVGAVDPLQTIGAHADSPALGKLAGEVGARLERVLARLPG